MSKISSIKVKKRKGEIEEYDPEKIKRVVIAAGLDKKQANELEKKLNKWVVSNGKNLITSLDIRDRIVIEIQKIDDYAAKKFIWWEKYKDKHLTN